LSTTSGVIVIEGKEYRLKEGHRKKVRAQEGARKWRKKGYLARVIEVGNEWRVYVHKRRV